MIASPPLPPHRPRRPSAKHSPSLRLPGTGVKGIPERRSPPRHQGHQGGRRTDNGFGHAQRGRLRRVQRSQRAQRTAGGGGRDAPDRHARVVDTQDRAQIPGTRSPCGPEGHPGIHADRRRLPLSGAEGWRVEARGCNERRLSLAGSWTTMTAFTAEGTEHTEDGEDGGQLGDGERLERRKQPPMDADGRRYGGEFEGNCPARATCRWSSSA